MKINKLAALILVLGAMVSQAAFGWDRQTIGKIKVIETYKDSANFPFRVSLVGYPGLCATGWNWAYLDAASGEYKAMSSLLLSAFAMNKSVQISVNRDASGYCRIEALSMFYD